MKCFINSNKEITDFWEDDSNAPEGALSCDGSIPSVSSFIDTDGNIQYCYTLTNGKVVINSVGTGYNLSQLRSVRNTKLAETDWTQSRDITLTNDADWATYRQALRDITDSATSLDDVTWPEKP
jgi:hypothetical protein